MKHSTGKQPTAAVTDGGKPLTLRCAPPPRPAFGQESPVTVSGAAGLLPSSINRRPPLQLGQMGSLDPVAFFFPFFYFFFLSPFFFKAQQIKAWPRAARTDTLHDRGVLSVLPGREVACQPPLRRDLQRPPSRDCLEAAWPDSECVM